MQQLITVPSNKFDGHGWCDPYQAEANYILRQAIDDEMRLSGEAKWTATLACFVEHRIAAALRSRDN
jgi:hypothetical protein